MKTTPMRFKRGIYVALFVCKGMIAPRCCLLLANPDGVGRARAKEEQLLDFALGLWLNARFIFRDWGELQYEY